MGRYLGIKTYTLDFLKWENKNKDSMKIEQVTPKLSSFMAVFPCFGKGFYIQYERTKNLITCKLIPVLLLALLCSACDYVAYSNNVNAEALKKIQKKKNFIYNIGFEGITSKVNYWTYSKK